MKCPCCGERAISFWDWAKGLRWYATKCDACGRKLKASPGTWIGVGVAAAVCGGGGFAYQMSDRAPALPVTLLIVFGLSFLVGGLVYYCSLGGYIAEDSPEDN